MVTVRPFRKSGSTVRQEIVGKQVSYSLSLWERARVRARSVARKEKMEGCSHCSLIPYPKPLPKREGVLEDGDLVLMTTAKFWRPTPSMNTLSADKNLSTVGRLLRSQTRWSTTKTSLLARPFR